jgi:hypothetical protein
VAGTQLRPVSDASVAVTQFYQALVDEGDVLNKRGVGVDGGRCFKSIVLSAPGRAHPPRRISRGRPSPPCRGSRRR